MGFNVKRIFRIASDKHGRKDNPQTDTDSPSEDDVYTQRRRNGTPHRQPPDTTATTATAASSTTSLWHPSRSRDVHGGHSQGVDNALPTRGIRKKASRIGRSKESGGYFNEVVPGASAAARQIESSLDGLFDELRNPSEDSKDALGVESTMGYLTSLGLNPESGEVFVALELVQAPSLGEITRRGFVDAWKRTPSGCTTKAEQASFVAGLVRQLSKDPAYFKRVYRYTFGAGKEPDQRSMSLDNAIEFWRVLFAPPGRPWKTATRNWTELWISFLREKWTRSVNRDMWNQTLEFAIKSTTDSTLSFWNEDGAWPSVIDDFVAWCREHGHASGGAKKDAMETDS